MRMLLSQISSDMESEQERENLNMESRVIKSAAKLCWRETLLNLRERKRVR